MKAPAIKSCMVNLIPRERKTRYDAIPHTTRPISIAAIRDAYTPFSEKLKSFIQIPATKPYAAISNAIERPEGPPGTEGIRGGIWNRKYLMKGAINPTSAPYTGPQINPHKSTGICIGESIFPISGICPVKNGSTRQRARHMPARQSFFVFFFIAKIPFKIKIP